MSHSHVTSYLTSTNALPVGVRKCLAFCEPRLGVQHALRLVIEQDNCSLQLTGLVSVVVGVVLLYVVS